MKLQGRIHVRRVSGAILFFVNLRKLNDLYAVKGGDYMNNSDCEMCNSSQNITSSMVTSRSDDERKKLLNRLKRIEGQVRGIEKMIEENAYCNDILIQSAAVNAAINAFNRELLSCHMHHCVIKSIKNGNDEIIDELMETLKKLMK